MDVPKHCTINIQLFFLEIVEERYEAIITAATQMEVWLSATCNEYSNPCADIYTEDALLLFL